MKRLGTVVNATQGLAIVRAPAEDYPSLGVEVIDEHLESVGSLVDVFGPVDRPYLAVSTDREPLAALVGAVLYVRSPS